MKKIQLITLSLLVLFGSCLCHANEYGGQTMVAPLKRVLIKRPDQSYAVNDPVKWHYTGKPHLQTAQREHDKFANTLKQNGVEVIYHDKLYPELADSIYVHDPAIITDKGAVILRMGKALRRGEEEAIAQRFQDLNIPIFYTLKAPATAEGGDTLWLDEHTLAVGRSFRTNQAAIDQLTQALAPIGVSVLPVELPYDQGIDACLHLQSLISFVDYQKAVVYKKLMPVSFVEELEKRHIKMIEVNDQEYTTMGPNILAIKPNVVLTIEGNEQIKADLEKEGVTVLTYQGDEISLRAEGGATCLTRPILRTG